MSKAKLGKVLVAMSGGVDSAVAAALLLKKGYDVIGATMRVWSDEDCARDGRRRCCSRDDVDDARGVAEKLGIPFYVLNFKDAFKREVIDYFCREYFKGFTPNPCIICNQKIKFGLLLRKAKQLGINFVASGHYAKIKYDPKRKRYRLFQAEDKKKDQSYVLFSLSQRQLSHILLPLGEYSKQRVREIAKKFDLKVAHKLDSQDICFVVDNDYRKLLEQKSKSKIKPGLIVDTQGKTLANHKGIPFFTIGQRKGLGMAQGKPNYVVRIDRRRNQIVVGTERDIMKKEFIARGVNWVGVEGLNGKNKHSMRQKRVEVKIRYAHPQSRATIDFISKESVRVRFSKPQLAITPGQAAVFYRGDEVIGGAWIKKIKN